MLALLASALLVTLAAVLLARAVAALVWMTLAGTRARRLVEARAIEAGHIGALAQRWSLTPAMLGGPILPGEGFGAVTFDTFGLAHDPAHADVRHTAVGSYRLIPVAPCATLSGCAALAGTEAPAGGGLLVVGTGEDPADAVAVLVLGPLVQVRLPAVPWAWVRELTTPETDPLAARVKTPAPVGAPVVEALVSEAPARIEAPATRTTRRAVDLPQRHRTMPSWRSPKPMTRRRDRAMSG